MTINFTLVGGATAVLEIAGLRLITDPTFDEPQSYHQPMVTIIKTAGPALSIDEIGPIDIVLASHDHEDNLDHKGRELLGAAPVGYTTEEVASKFGNNVKALAEYETVTLPLPEGGELSITGVPAQHGPDGVHQLIGPVIGFVLSGEGLPTVYVSGDNSSLEVIQEIQDKCGPIAIAVLFTGAPSFEAIADGAHLTLSNEKALEAAQTILTDSIIVPIHTDSWDHFTQTSDQIEELFAGAGLSSRLIALRPGQSVSLPAALPSPTQ